MTEFWRTFWSDDRGQGLTEYALIIGLVSVAMVLVLTAMRDEIGRVFNEITSQLANVGPTQVSP